MKTLLALLMTALPLAAANFNAKEFNFDSGVVTESVDITKNPEFGAAIGGSYFFTRGFGAGARLIAYDTSGSGIDKIAPRLLFRAPLWDKIAPYGYVEGTYSFQRDCWGAGAGGGIELRPFVASNSLLKRIAFFGEAGLDLETTGRGSVVGYLGIRIPLGGK